MKLAGEADAIGKYLAGDVEAEAAARVGFFDILGFFLVVYPSWASNFPTTSPLLSKPKKRIPRSERRLPLPSTPPVPQPSRLYFAFVSIFIFERSFATSTLLGDFEILMLKSLKP